MRKFFAVVKHEYKKVVLKWSFLVGTLLFPVIASAFAVVPALIFSVKGEPTRIAVVDTSGKIESRLKANLTAEKMAERAKKAAEDSMKITADQAEKAKNNMAMFEDSFNFVDFSQEGKSSEKIRSSWLI